MAGCGLCAHMWFWASARKPKGGGRRAQVIGSDADKRRRFDEFVKSLDVGG